MHGMFDYLVPGKIAKLSEMLDDNKFLTGVKVELYFCLILQINCLIISK